MEKTTLDLLLSAEGATAEVFAWGAGRILKLYRAGSPPGEAKREAECARLAAGSGLSTPAVYEVVTIEGRQGVVYERIEGGSMLNTLLAQPGRHEQLARQMAELHVAIHRCSVSGLPTRRERLKRDIRTAQLLPDPIRNTVLAALDRLPDDSALCHGDFHPSNILLAERGPVIIDWVDATLGNPMADVARTCLLIQTGGLPTFLSESERSAIELLRQRFCDAYLERYRQLKPYTNSDLKAWLPLVAAARLSERGRSPEEIAALLRLAVGDG